MGCGASKTTVVVAGTESAPSPVPTKPSEVPESKAGGDQTPSNASSGTASVSWCGRKVMRMKGEEGHFARPLRPQQWVGKCGKKVKP